MRRYTNHKSTHLLVLVLVLVSRELVLVSVLALVLKELVTAGLDYNTGARPVVKMRGAQGWG